MFGCGVGVGDEVIAPSLTYWATCLQAFSLGATIVFMLAIQFMPRTPLLSRLVLAGSETAESGFVVASAGRRHLIGKTGIVTSDLRPSGRAEIDGETMIVVADGEFVERGLPVTVTDVRGNRVVVSRA